MSPSLLRELEILVSTWMHSKSIQMSCKYPAIFRFVAFCRILDTTLHKRNVNNIECKLNIECNLANRCSIRKLTFYLRNYTNLIQPHADKPVCTFLMRQNDNCLFCTFFIPQFLRKKTNRYTIANIQTTQRISHHIRLSVPKHSRKKQHTISSLQMHSEKTPPLDVAIGKYPKWLHAHKSDITPRRVSYLFRSISCDAARTKPTPRPSATIPLSVGRGGRGSLPQARIYIRLWRKHPMMRWCDDDFTAGCPGYSLYRGLAERFA